MNLMKGLGVSPGIARGEALVLRQRARHRYYLVPKSAIEQELDRLTQARERSRTQLEEISSRIGRLAGAAPASLFEAQLLMLDDPMLTARATELIRQNRRNAEWAVQQAADELGAMFNQADDPYLRERKGDLQDVIGRLRMNLTGDARASLDVSPLRAGAEHGPDVRARGAAGFDADDDAHAGAPSDEDGDDAGMSDDAAALDASLTRSYTPGGPSVIVADDLPPSIAAQIDWTKTLAFITEVGSWTYHTAILARSLGVPAIVGVRDATDRIAPGSEIIVDGTTGEVFLDVNDATEQEIMRRRHERARVAASWSAPREVEPITQDGVRIRLDANLELADDLADAVQAGAEGIGLYRSEFLLAGRAAQTVGEAAQSEVYRDLLTRMPGDVTIRTFDTREVFPRGVNQRRVRPGLRALRVEPEFQKQFEIQIRALLRASAAGRLRILLPFVTGVEDVRSARAIITTVAQQLRNDGVTVPDVPVGAMIEVPSAALTADRLAAVCDFFSIGTNDLVSLTLATDRADERTPQLHDPLHPAILRLLRLVRRASAWRGRGRQGPAHSRDDSEATGLSIGGIGAGGGIDALAGGPPEYAASAAQALGVPAPEALAHGLDAAQRARPRRLSVCGEMASDPALLMLLVGLGFTEFSMAPAAIPRARHIVRHISVAAAKRLAREILSVTPEEGRARLDAAVQRAEETPLVTPL